MEEELEAKWYVLHTFSGYEVVAKTNLEVVIKKYHLEDRIFDIVERKKHLFKPFFNSIGYNSFVYWQGKIDNYHIVSIFKSIFTLYYL